MKKLSFFLMAMLVSLTSFAADYSATNTSNVSFTIGTKAYDNKIKIEGTEYQAIKLGTASVVGDMSFTIPANTAKIHLHIVGWSGKSSAVKISASNDVTLGTTEITATSDAGMTGNSPFTLSDASKVTTDYYHVIELSSPTTAETTITMTSVSGKYRVVIWGVNTEEATSGEQGETVDAPTFSATEANFTEAFNLTITSAESTTLKYTTDKTDPTTSETAVAVESNTAIVSIPAKSTMVKAVAVKGELVSSVKSMTFCYVNSEATAYTVTEALAIYNEGLGLSNKLYIKGSVKNIEDLSTEYGNATYTITDGDNDLYIYRGKNFGGEKFTSADQLFVGDDLVLYGQLTSYNGNPQVAANNEIISRESKTKSIIAEDLTFDAIALGAEVEAQTLTVTGANLTAEITATLDNEKFTVTPATLPAAGGDLTIAPAADLAVGEHTATLSLTSGEVTKEVALSILVKDVYAIEWYVNGEIYDETTVVEGDKLVLPAAPEAPEACSEKVFVGWTAAEEVNADGSKIEWITATTVPTAAATYYAVFALQEGEGGASEVVDVLDRALTGVEGTNYASWADVSATSDAVYAGQSAGGNEAIQLRSNNSNSGVISTTSGGKLAKVTVAWNSNTASGRTLNIYGSNSAYTAPTDLYGDASGEKLGTIVFGTSTELVIEGDYAYVGLRSNSGAMYLDEIQITWTSGAAATYTDYSTTCEPEIEWMPMELEINNLTTQVMEVGGAKYLMMMGGNEEMGESVNIFLNNYADVDDDYEVNAESSLIVYMGYEFTVIEGTITQTSETEKGTLYTGSVYAYTEIEGETMYAAFTLTMYAAPVTVLVLTDAIVAINEKLGTLTFNVPTGEDEGYYAELAGYTAPGVHEGPQICLFETPEVIAYATYVETEVVDGVITLTGEFTSPMGPKFDLTISGTLPVVEEPEVEKPEPTYTENNLNPYAFGLESKLSADKETLTVTYRLNNSNATSVNVLVYNGEEVVATVAGTTTIGKNTVEVATADLPGGVELTWSVEVNGTSVEAPTKETKIYSFYHPSGLDIDNNPENETFGMLLVNEAMQSAKGAYQSNGLPYVSTPMGAGIFAFTPSFDLIPNGELPGYNGGNVFTTTRADGTGTAYAPRRIRISEDGRIFVTSLNTDGNYLWEVNPASMDEWTPVFKGTLNDQKELVDAEGNFIAAPNQGFDVKGSGENLQLAMYSVNLSGITAAAMGGFRLHEYNLGTATEWTTVPSKALVEGKYAINYVGTQVEYDNEGGYWIASYRGTASDANPGLVHINAEGVEDCKLVWNNVRQAGIRFNKDFTKLVVAGNNGAAKKATIYTISKDANGAPVLNQETVVDMTAVGNNLNDFAWDYAGNLYSCGNSSEKLAAWAMPYSGTVETPAASKYAFELDYNVQDITMTNLEVQEMGELVVLTASDELNTGLNVTLAINKDGSINEMSYASIISGWMETELPIVEGTITKTYSEELATDVYSGLVVVENMGGYLGLQLTMYAVPAAPAVDVVATDANIYYDEYGSLCLSANWNGETLNISGIEVSEEPSFMMIEEIFGEGEEDWYIWMSYDATATVEGNVLTIAGEFVNNLTGDTYNVTITGTMPQGTATDVDNLNSSVAPVKILKNGQVIIIKNGVQYSVQGQVIK